MKQDNNQFVDNALIEKWLPVLEGTGKWDFVQNLCPKVKSSNYGVMAQMLENIVTESTSADAIGDYKPILISMTRRIMPSLIGMDIFGTQPMKGPTGLIFALRAYYGNDTNNPVNRSNSVILTLADASTFPAGGNISQTGNTAVGIIRYKEGNNVLVEVVSGTFTSGANVDDTASFVATATSISALYDNEALAFVVFKNYTGSHATAVGEKLSTDMKEVGFKIDTTPVTAQTRKLKAKWTVELEEDLRAIHDMDAESLLSSIASDEIIMEMNREFLGLVDTKSIAGGNTGWNYNNADGRWEIEKYRNLEALISRVKREIALSSRRGQGNFMVVSPTALSMLEATGGMSSEGVDPYNQAFAGTFRGQMKVYVDIFAQSEYINIGYKGPNEIDAGIYYAPYVPLKITKGMGPEDGQPRTFFKTRYATADNVFGAEKYFRRITISGDIGADPIMGGAGA